MGSRRTADFMCRINGLAYPQPSGGGCAADPRRSRGATCRAVPRQLRAASRLREIVADTYAGFDDPRVAPLRELASGLWLLELFHGPTLAFKDYALQLVGRLFDRCWRSAAAGSPSSARPRATPARRRSRRRRDRATADIFMLYPARPDFRGAAAADDHRAVGQCPRHRGRRQLRRLPGFGEGDVRRRAVPRRVQSVGSQLDQLGAHRGANRLLRLCRAGAGCARQDDQLRGADRQFRQCLCRPCRAADGIADRATCYRDQSQRHTRALFRRAAHESRTVEPSLSPSMDIQVSSNFERLFFDLRRRDGARRGRGDDAIPRAPAPCRRADAELAEARQLFSAYPFDDDATLAEIERTWRERRRHARPAQRRRRSRRPAPIRQGDRADGGAGHAHPAKFPDAIERAIGRRPVCRRASPPLMTRPERLVRVPNELEAVEYYMRGSCAPDRGRWRHDRAPLRPLERHARRHRHDGQGRDRSLGV